jgi:hypothetical protein
VGAVRAVIELLVLLLTAAAILVARSGTNLDPYLTGGLVDPAVAALSPSQLKSAAADKLEAATSKGGSGYAFEIVQTSTIAARPGGPLVDIPDPANGRVIIGQASEYPYYTLLEHGVVTPAGFWSELRSWPVGAGEPEWDKAELRRSALVRDGETWRNDRQGWYQAKVVPGIGLDPATAALLPRLLRQSAAPAKLPDAGTDGAGVLRVAATGEVRDMPGVVSADGEAETRITEPIQFSFDGIGRLVEIHVVALNTNLEGDYDLAVDTVIAIRYDGVSSLPAPVPAFDANATEEVAR